MLKKTKIKILPAILEKNFSEIEKKILKVWEYVDLVQIDICDGKLTPSKTFASSGCFVSFEKLLKIKKKIWKLQEKKGLKKSFDIEIDLIVDMENGPKGRGDKFLNSIFSLNPKRIIFHFSGVKDWDKIFSFFKENKMKTKIALGIWLSDDVKKINKLMEKYNFDYIQIMGIDKVGYGGQKLSKKIFKKIEYFSKKYPEKVIQIDGGVKITNVQKLKKFGASSFVVGSGIYKTKNIKNIIEEFKKI